VSFNVCRKFVVPFLLIISPVLFVACKQNGSKQKAGAEEQAAVSVFDKPPVSTYTEAIKKDPKNAENFYKRGVALHKLREDSMALDDFNKAVSIDSTQARYLSAIGDLMFEHKDVSGSVKWLQRALQRDPSDIKAHLKLAKVMIFAQEYPKAFAEINTVLRNDAYNPEGYFLKGIVYKEMKDTLKAISSFQTCINVFPDYREAYIQLGQLYNMKRNPMGMKYLENAFKLDTTDLFPLYAKGMYYQEQQRFEEAKAEYKRCILIDPQYEDALFAQGYILLQQDSFEKANRQFDLAAKAEPDNADAYYNRGLTNELMGKTTAAISDYEQALIFRKEMKKAQEGIKRLKK